MKNIIFLALGLFLIALFPSCTKKTLLTSTPQKIEWYDQQPQVAKTTEKVLEESFTHSSGSSTHVLPTEINIEKASVVNFQEVAAETVLSDDRPDMSRKEARKAIKKELKEVIKEKRQDDTNTLLLVLIAILLPPVAVGLVRGWSSGAFWLNILLTILFYVPGLIHALIIVLSR